MKPRLGMLLFALSLASSLLSPALIFAQMAAAIAVSSETILATSYTEGAQVYECKLAPANKLV